MLLIVCALSYEAKPLISFFNLKSSTSSSPFPVYEKDGMKLIVSGIGKTLSAAATGYLHAISGHLKHAAWLNIGIAGHPTLPIGTGALAHKITDQATGWNDYPFLIKELTALTTSIPVISVDQPEFAYPKPSAYDMEAASFYRTASLFSTNDLVHVFKVISDNQQAPARWFKKQVIEDLISQHLPLIDKIATCLQIYSLSQTSLYDVSCFEKLFLDHWHFTATQRHRLRSLLIRWKACSLDSPPVLKSLKHAQEVLNTLEAHLNSQPLKLR